MTVDAAARAHLAALEKAPGLGAETFILSAPPPFTRAEAQALLEDTPGAIARHFPDAAALYAARGWMLPDHIDRVYDPGRAERLLGFRPLVDFSTVLAALRSGADLPFVHDPDYSSPKEK